MLIEEKVIPKSLIYEMVNGKPIYYRGYKKVLANNLKLESIIGSSFLQSLIITEIINFLAINLTSKKTHQWFTSEMGLHLNKGENRACDIAIYEKTQLKNHIFEDKYATIPPKIVIEVDTKANLDEEDEVGNYFHYKTQQLLDFGVEKVIWINTNPKNIMLATAQKPWLIIDWTTEFEIIENLTINLSQLIDNKQVTNL
jgi:Uma2 family endonuclease